MAAVNSGPSPRAGRTQGRVERGAGMPAGLPALAAPLAALAGMAGVRSAGRALPPPKAAPPRGAVSAAGAGVAGAGACCTVPVAAPTGAPIVPCAAAGRFQASAVVISRAAGTVRRMR